jgi:hypothetical protein
MATFDWKKLVGGLAPTLGAALGGPMAGMAVKVIADAVLGKPDATEAEVSAALLNGNLTGEQIVALRSADKSFDVRMKELDIDIMKVNQTTELAYVTDTNDARKAFGGNENVFALGVVILVSFAVLMGSVLTGCFLMMTGYFKVDPNVAAICAGLIGTVIGYVAANAQQVVSYFYGSSKGSKEGAERIGSALTESIKQAGARS